MRYLKCISSILIMATFHLGMAQQLVVLDSQNNEPIENVAAFSEDSLRSSLSDSLGILPLTPFQSNEKITLQHPSFESQQFIMAVPIQGNAFIYLTPLTQNLEEVILSVARSQSNRNEIAEKVTVISSKTISRSPLGTGADLLAMTPGVRIQKSQGGGGSPVLRGFEANRVLLVVDGVRMNNAIYRSGHLQNAITIDPNTIERVEVMFGSSSVGYGSDALGGVIHYYTKSPQLNRVEPLKLNFSSEYNSATQAGLYHASASVSKEKWGSITSVSYSQFGDIKMGERRAHGFLEWGLSNYYSENSSTYFQSQPTINDDPTRQRNTGYSQYDLMQKFLFQLPGAQQLMLNMQLSNSSNIDRFDKLNESRDGTLRFSEWYYGPQKRLLLSAQYKLFPEKKWLRKGTLTAAYQNVLESRNQRKFGNLTRTSQNENVNVLSVNGDFNTQLNQKNQINYGFEGVYNHVYSRGFSRELSVSGNTISRLGLPLAIPSRYPSDGSSTQSFAMYGNWILKKTPKWIFNFGYRLTHYVLDAQWNNGTLIDTGLRNNIHLSSEALTWTLAAIHRPSDQMQWNLLVSNGFKAPNVDDIGKIRENNGALVVPNPFLLPEYAYNVDLGFSLFSKDKKSQLTLRNYLTLVSRHIVRSNYIVFSDTTTPDKETILYDGEALTTVANKNLGNRLVYGSAIDAKLQLSPRLQGIGNLTYTGSDNNERYGPMPSISPLFGSFTIEYDHAKLQLRAQYQFSAAKDSSNYSLGGEDSLEETPLINPTALLLTDQFGGMPAWSDFSLLANYQWNATTKLKAGIENIFDTHYRTFASGVSAPGRSFRIGLQIAL